MVTKESVLAQYEEEFNKLSEYDKDVVIAACACGNHQPYTTRTLMEAMRDPNHEEGQRMLQSAVELLQQLEGGL